MQSKNKSIFVICGFLITWFAVIAQLILHIQNVEMPLGETLIRFFSYFTILTNILVAVYFTTLLFPQASLNTFFKRPGTPTAVIVYITVVGITYNLLLRNVWNPQGLQKVVDILLHTISPLFCILFWFLFEEKKGLTWKLIPGWLIYPLCYSVLIMILGAVSNYYPYPFIDVTRLGYPSALFNTLGLFLFFTFVSACFIGIGRAISSK